MNIKFNGKAKPINDNANLQMLISEYLNGKEAKGLAAALNENIVPRSKWETTALKENDSVEVVHAVQGG
jgi:sulfur carrier protein